MIILNINRHLRTIFEELTYLGNITFLNIKSDMELASYLPTLSGIRDQLSQVVSDLELASSSQVIKSEPVDLTYPEPILDPPESQEAQL